MVFARSPDLRKISSSFMAECQRNSFGVQITGQRKPSDAQAASIRRLSAALLMCLQFHVSRKSMPWTEQRIIPCSNYRLAFPSGCGKRKTTP